MTDKLRIGAIGAGYWGPNLIRNFVEIPHSNLVAVADLSEKNRERMQSRFPTIQTFTDDYKNLFDMNLDAIIIATPPFTHHDIARDCLEHDLHVMVEKPLTLDSESSRDLINIAAERNLRLMVGHVFEYNPAVRAIRDIINSGELGEIYYLDAVRTNLGLFHPSLDVMWDLAPHDISTILFLLGQSPESIQVSGGASIWDEVCDLAYMHLNFADGKQAHVRVSWLDPQKVRRITVVGSKKMLVYDDVSPLEKLKIFDKGVEAPPYTETFGDFQMSYRYGDIVIPHISGTEPLRLECEHFIESIMAGTDPQTDGWNGLRVVRVLEAASESLANKGVAVDFDISALEAEAKSV
ncbi:MAG: Gfo/Idh/MocA family protein [Aggregatilineales bacterium]